MTLFDTSSEPASGGDLVLVSRLNNVDVLGAGRPQLVHRTVVDDDVLLGIGANSERTVVVIPHTELAGWAEGVEGLGLDRFWRIADRLGPDTLDGGSHVVALNPGSEVLRVQYGFGFQADGPDGVRRHCVGVAALADDEDPRHALEPLVRRLATAHRFGAPEELRWTSIGVESIFSGLEILTQTTKATDASP